MKLRLIPLDDLTEGLCVMAPWYDDNSLMINHAKAVVIVKGKHSAPTNFSSRQDKLS